MFTDEEHRDTVIKAIRNEKFHKILLLGTSEKMVHKVCETLQLPAISEIIHIETVSTKDEINKALASRAKGEHVIPVPVLEVHKDYENIILSAINLIGKRFGKSKNQWEKAVVNPPFQYGQGSLKISKEALTQMINHCLDEVNSGLRIQKIRFKMIQDQYEIKVMVEGPYGIDYNSSLYKAHDYIIAHIKQYTGLTIKRLDLELGRIVDQD